MSTSDKMSRSKYDLVPTYDPYTGLTSDQADMKALNDSARYYISSSLTEQFRPVIQEFDKFCITLEHNIFLRYRNKQKTLK